MDESKPWFMSRSVWGALVAIAAGIGGTFGIMIAEQDQATLTDAILQIAGAVGAVVALYGRLSASQILR